MRNFYKPIQDKKVVVVVEGRSVTFTNEKGQVVRFLASDEDFSIKYNTGALGGEYCAVDEGTCAYTEPNPKDFVNGGTYTAYYIAYFTERKCRRANGTSDYYDEMYVELKTDDGYYSDILLHSSTITIFVDEEELSRLSVEFSQDITSVLTVCRFMLWTLCAILKRIGKLLFADMTTERQTATLRLQWKRSARKWIITAIR